MGGKETNRFFGWTDDGLRLALGANTRNPAAIDAYLIDPLTASTAAAALRNAPGVRIDRGVTSSQTISTMRRPD